MKPYEFDVSHEDDYPKKKIVPGAIILLAPPLLMLVGFLWLFDWVNTYVVPFLVSSIDSFLTRLR